MFGTWNCRVPEDLAPPGAMATFFPTTNEARAAVRWIKKHPFVAAVAAAAAVASVVSFYRRERDRSEKRKAGDEAQDAECAGSVATPNTAGFHRSVSWCDDSGHPLTQTIDHGHRRSALKSSEDPSPRAGCDDAGGDGRTTPGSQEGQWGWYVAMTPPTTAQYARNGAAQQGAVLEGAVVK